MADDTASDLVIRSSRGRLLVQAALLLAATGFGVWLVEQWAVLRPGILGRVIPLLGLSLLGALWAGLGLLATWVIFDANRKHRIILAADHLTIRDVLGSYRIPYAVIAGVRRIQFFGAGIALRDAEPWLESLDPEQVRVAKRRRVSEITRSAYGCDVCIDEKNLEGGSAGFVQLLLERLQHYHGGPLAEAE